MLKIFFDVDGVLVDGWHDKPERRRPWDTTIAKDLGIDREAFRQIFFGLPTSAAPPPLHFCAKGERDLKDELSVILPRVGYHGPVETVMRYWFERDSHLHDAVFERVKHLAQREDVELYLATGQDHYRAGYLWDELGFKKYFRHIFYSAKLGYTKNEAGFFQKINDSLDLATEIAR